MSELVGDGPTFARIEKIPDGDSIYSVGPDHILRLNEEDGIPDAISHTQKFRDLLDVLHTDYGIQIPNPSYYFDPNDPSCTYTLCERVTEFEDVPQNIGADTLSSITRYYCDVIFSGGEFLSDIGVHQFMYGSIPSDPQPKDYLVDLDTYIATYDKNKPDSEVTVSLYAKLHSLALDATDLRETFNIDTQDIHDQIRRAVGALPYLPPSADLTVEQLYNLLNIPW